MKKILIVDDEKPFILSLQDGLNIFSEQLRVYSSFSGEEAISLINDQKFDLILLDLKMPGISGFDIMTHVKSHKLSIPIIVMTAYGTPEKEEFLRKYGVIDYLDKPLDLQLLLEVLKKELKL